MLAGVVESTRSWRRHAGLALFLLALAALLVGFARPSVNRLADREEATIVLVIDVSGSMQAEDVEPTRLAAAQKVVRDFMKGLPKRFRVGVVSFSETAEVAAPATEDRQLAIDAIDYLYAQRGTAIGDGLARGVEVAREAEIGPDGTGDRDGSGDGDGAASGRDPPALRRLADRRGAAAARGRRAGRSPSRSRSTRSRSARPRASSSSTASAERGSSRCRPTSRRCGRSPRPTGGKFYKAESVGELREAYENMGSLVSKVERKQEVTFAFLAVGLLLMLAAAAVAVVTFPRLP